MNVEEFRQRLPLEADNLSDEMIAQMESCEECQAIAEQFLSQGSAMDTVVREALDVDVPPNLGQTVLMQKILQRRQRSRGPLFALAATVLMGVGLAAGVFLGRSQVNEELTNHLMAHVEHELQLLEPTDARVSINRVSYVLSQAKINVRSDIGSVRHAGLCEFRGHKVPHLVVQTEAGPVTVMLLPHEKVKKVQSFEYGEFQGVIVPNGSGSIAIIGGDSSQLEPVRQQFEQAVEYSI